MNKEQIARRIQDEFRKHSGLPDQDWMRIAAGKIHAEIHEPVAGSAYYFVAYWFRDNRPHADHEWHPSNAVITDHPFTDKAIAIEANEFLDVRLVSWREITRTEYDLYSAQNP